RNAANHEADQVGQQDYRDAEIELEHGGEEDHLGRDALHGVASIMEELRHRDGLEELHDRFTDATEHPLREALQKVDERVIGLLQPVQKLVRERPQPVSETT